MTSLSRALKLVAAIALGALGLAGLLTSLCGGVSLIFIVPSLLQDGMVLFPLAAVAVFGGGATFYVCGRAVDKLFPSKAHRKGPPECSATAEDEAPKP